jgi:DNA-binding response OmpR family regulator
MPHPNSILLAEEDSATRSFLAENLRADGYQVLEADHRQGALAKLSAHPVDLVICDVNGETLQLLDAVRQGPGLAGKLDPGVPLIVLTARPEEVTRLRFLDRGGDDVLRKPFSYPELLARVRALLRRAQRTQKPRLDSHGLRIDTVAREVRVGERLVELAGMEYALLVHLAREPTRVYTKVELLRDVWHFQAEGRTRTLDPHACRLRRKLADAGAPRLVQAIWGVGYRLAPPEPYVEAGRAA